MTHYDLGLGVYGLTDLNRYYFIVIGEAYFLNMMTTLVPVKDNSLFGFINLFDVWVIDVRS